MKLLTPQKQVSYHGIILMVPEWTKYLATDMDGCIYAYDIEPYISDIELIWCMNSDGIECNLIDLADLDGTDWMSTKEKI